jgi:predicted lipid-binding transport protein (Tim44 family)
MLRHRWLIALAAIATALTLVATDAADARAGRGFSGGSRGARTFSAPAPTRTAPTAAPVQRTVTQPSAATTGAAGATRPGLLGGGLFGGGMLGGLAAGFIGAGLFGMLFGHGFMGGMGGFASILGLLLQIGLVIVVARLAFAWWQRRNAPAYATQAASPAPGASTAGFGGFGGMFGGNAPAGEPITIAKSDYDDFEQLLGEIQAAYSAEDLSALRAHVTPEMVSYFAEDLAENASRGVINRVTDVKLLQGDLSEAWREGDIDYATVAMHFALTDSMVERASGRVVEGGSPSEVTELWTFRRARNGAWLLSAIQQA